MLGLVGESGCGKTMTARSLLGLLPPGVSVTGGSIRWQGRELVGLSEKELNALRGREIALISQEPMVALDPMFSVAYQLTQPIRRFRKVGRGEARQIAARAAAARSASSTPERVLKTYPHQLSGGMAQRVASRWRSPVEPKLLIADEPTTALDVTVQAEILSLLRALVRDTGLSMIIVSHDLGVVADICDDVAVMYAGQVVESGSTAPCPRRPGAPVHDGAAGGEPARARGRAGAAAAGLHPRHRPARPAAWPTGCRFAARCHFVQEKCTVPFPALPAHGDGSVLCIRVDEIHGAHLTWEPEHVGAETQPTAESAS